MRKSRSSYFAFNFVLLTAQLLTKIKKIARKKTFFDAFKIYSAMLFMPQNKSEREEGFFTVKIKTRNNLIRLQFVSLACPSLKRARIASRYDVHTPKKKKY